MTGRFVIVLAAGVLLSFPLSAHHGGAAFDNGKKVTLKGTVTQWVYMNPHCLISMDVTGEDGKVVNWVIETQAPGIMYPAGYRKDSFKPGDEITAVVEPVKNGQPVGRIQTVVTATGWTLGGINSKAIPPGENK
jgi:hypothetical protein